MSFALATTVLDTAGNFTSWLNFHLQRCAVIPPYVSDPMNRGVFETLCGSRAVEIFDGAAVSPAMSRPSRLLLRQSSNLRHAPCWAEKSGLPLGGCYTSTRTLLFENGQTSWRTNPSVGYVTSTNHEAVQGQHDTQNGVRRLCLVQPECPPCKVFHSIRQWEERRALEPRFNPILRRWLAHLYSKFLILLSSFIHSRRPGGSIIRTLQGGHPLLPAPYQARGARIATFCMMPVPTLLRRRRPRLIILLG